MASMTQTTRVDDLRWNARSNRGSISVTFMTLPSTDYAQPAAGDSLLELAFGGVQAELKLSLLGGQRFPSVELRLNVLGRHPKPGEGLR
ncbi:hypothetical protein [Agromyces sp. NPDC058104]|uniref:hypothetical protein n=1 Tax=Agromyces sp. NPDC058104 TaxID=3346342 RepID=UPI0036DC9D06